jgi:hypothetical protein
MSAATSTPRARRVISRISEIAAEMDYAQRRLLEIRTGTPFRTRGRNQRQSRD